MPLEDSPYVKGMRRRTLQSLTNAALDWQPTDAVVVDPNKINAALNWQPPRPQPRPQPAPPASSAPQARRPWHPPTPAINQNAPRQWPPPALPAPPPVQADPSFNPNLDLQLGFQSGLAGLTNMIYKPAASIYGGKLVPITESMAEQVGPDPETLASRSEPSQRATQFIGRLPTDAARYSLATAAAGGNPILGAAAADALGAETPQQAITQGVLSGLGGAALHYGLPALAEYAPQVARKAISVLPSREELQAAGEAANARLRASEEGYTGGAAQTTAAAVTPGPPAPGFTRMYHGGFGPINEPRWFTSDLRYAQGYADKSGAPVHYVDIPTNHPLIEPQWPEESIALGFHQSVQLPAEIATRAEPFSLSSREKLQAAGEAANARLRASGIYSGATASMGQYLNPATIRDMAISTGAQLGSGLYTAGEAAAARAKLVKNWITDMRNRGLTPEEQDKFAQARQASPELHEVGDLMLPLEARKVISSPQSVEAVSRMLRVIPDSAKLAATAKMGVSKLGWYRGSSQALMDVFGEDAPRFAQLLAAMSPQTSVESNLRNALNTWKNWVAEGRPTNAADIKRIMGASVQGGTEKSALDAWVNNSVSALSAQDPMQVTLSGPKVDSFYHNLRDDVFRVTNDAWMANAYGIAQNAFQGQGANVLAGNPGMTPQYAAASARLRDAALKAGMLPSQGQETIWSTAMQLYELARSKGLHPREVLERGMLTPEIIRGAPDFSTLLKEPQYARILEQAGYGPQVEAMQQFQFPETTVPMSAAEQEQLGHVANILGETARIRGDVSQATKFAFPKGVTEPAETPSGSIQMEAQPSLLSGHFPEIATQPYGSKAAYLSGLEAPYENLRGQNIFLANPAMNVKAQPVTGGIGAYTPKGGIAETNPARSEAFTAPLQWTPEGPQVEPQTMANVRGAAALQGVPFAQEAVGIPVVIPNPEKGQNLSIRLPNKPTLRPEEMQALQQKYPDFAFVHAGSRLHVLNFKNLDMPKEMKDDMLKLVRGKSYVEADNVGDYLDFAKQWAQTPGQGAVTGHMMDYVNQMTPEAQAAIDQDVRDSAGKTLGFYNQKIRTQGWTPRQDLMNLLQIMRDQGLDGVREGLKKGAFLPGLVGALLAPHLLQQQGGGGAPPPAAPAPTTHYPGAKPNQ